MHGNMYGNMINIDMKFCKRVSIVSQGYASALHFINISQKPFRSPPLNNILVPYDDPSNDTDRGSPGVCPTLSISYKV